MLNRLLTYLVLCLWLFAGQIAFAQTVIYQDDFESGIFGWSVNDSDYDNDVTNFLGRFADVQTTTSRSFAIPAGSTQVDIEFDLYRFDSWDTHAGDGFELDIDGTSFFFTFASPTGSGSSGNVSWTYSRTRGPEHFAFANYSSDPWWREELFFFEVTVANPGANVTLTLRGDFNQAESDESIGYDNFLVTANPPVTGGNVLTAIAETFTSIDGATGGVTSSVLTSDTLGGAPATLSNVSISVVSSDPEITLNPASGLISIPAGTAAGTYMLIYEICEIAEPTNCDSVTETVVVFDSSTGGGGGVCPAGTTTIAGTYHTVSATSTQQNPQLTIGAPLAEGTSETGGNSATSYFGPITMDLTGDPNILVPEGELVEVVLSSAWNNQALAEILTSVDGVNFTSLGTTGNGGTVYGPWTSNILRYDDFIMPPGGARYLQVYRLNQGVRADGVIYSNQCQATSTPPVIVAGDDTQTLPFSASTQSNVLNVVTNDTFDGALPSAFDLSINAGSTQPPELIFDATTGNVSVAAGAPAGTYSFDYDICEVGTTNCDTATVTITIQPAPAVIVAVDDSLTLPFSAAAQASVLNVATNDTFDGTAPSSFDLNVNSGSSLPPELTFDLATGDVGVIAGAPAGTYVFDYDICESGTTNCETATVTITIDPAPVVIVATDDAVTLPFSAAAQTNVLNIVTNDTFDGAVPSSFDLSVNAASTQPPELIFDASTGNVSAAAGAPAGTYSFDYDICEVGTKNCDTATVTVIIEPGSPSLSMTKVASAPGPYNVGDVVTYTYTVTNDGDTIVRDIAINDTHNGSDPAPTPSNETLLTDAAPVGDSTDAATDGNWEVLAPGDVITFTGTYIITQADADNL